MSWKLCYVIFISVCTASAYQQKPKALSIVHTPMWTATIDLKTKTFISITDEGKPISKKIDVVSKKNSSSIIVKSKDGSLYIKLYQTKNCDCVFDIPEKETSQWNAEVHLNKKKRNACVY